MELLFFGINRNLTCVKLSQGLERRKQEIAKALILRIKVSYTSSMVEKFKIIANDLKRTE